MRGEYIGKYFPLILGKSLVAWNRQEKHLKALYYNRNLEDSALSQEHREYRIREVQGSPGHENSKPMVITLHASS